MNASASRLTATCSSPGAAPGSRIVPVQVRTRSGALSVESGSWVLIGEGKLGRKGFSTAAVLPAIVKLRVPGCFQRTFDLATGSRSLYDSIDGPFGIHSSRVRVLDNPHLGELVEWESPVQALGDDVGRALHVARGPEGLRGPVGRQHDGKQTVHVAAGHPGLEVEDPVSDNDFVLKRKMKLETYNNFINVKELLKVYHWVIISS